MNEAFFTTEVLSGKTEKLLIYFALPKNLRRNGKHLISINRRTDKEDVLHIYTMEYFSVGFRIGNMYTPVVDSY